MRYRNEAAMVWQSTLFRGKQRHKHTNCLSQPTSPQPCMADPNQGTQDCWSTQLCMQLQGQHWDFRGLGPYCPPYFFMAVVPWNWGDLVTEEIPTSPGNLLPWKVRTRQKKIKCVSTTYWKTKERPLLSTCCRIHSHGFPGREIIHQLLQTTKVIR